MCSVFLIFSNSFLRWLSIIRIVNVSVYSGYSDRLFWLLLNKGVQLYGWLCKLLNLLAYFSRNAVLRVGIWLLLINGCYIFQGVCYNSLLTGSSEQRYVYLYLCNAIGQRSLFQQRRLSLFELEGCYPTEPISIGIRFSRRNGTWFSGDPLIQ